MCGRAHSGKQQDPECTRLCVKLGADFALVVGQKVYVLRGHQAELYQSAGETVMVRGRIVGGNIVAVDSVEPSVIEALDRATARATRF
jgi:hypothetical protein